MTIESEEYPFALDEREYPVYNSKNKRVGNCKKINLCRIEKTKIRVSDEEHQNRNTVKRFIERYIPNNVFLQIKDMEEFIALRPWNLEHVESNPKENYTIPDYGATYFIIPIEHCDMVEEKPLMNITSKYSSPSEAILLKIKADYLEDLSDYRFFELIGEKIKLLK